MTCRYCNGTNIFDAIDLGTIPVAGSFLKTYEEKYDLIETKMVVCSDCGLGQISKDIEPEKLYQKYNWRTSTSNSYIKYIHNFADQYIIPNVSKNEWVLEIASNDGYLLKYLKDKGIDVLGVDPAKNISMYAICDGVPIITDFFNSEIAKEIVRLKGHPKHIIANNVMAHTPDINSFVKGLSILANNNTIITVENPSIINILTHQHFDVIFHEHYSYLSNYFVDNITKNNDLVLFNTESVDIQGGSNRYWISKNKQVLESVNKAIQIEKDCGLLDKDTWQSVYYNIKENIASFKNRVKSINNQGGIVCGFAASAKSTVTMNFAGIEPGQIKFIADDVMEKQNHIIPGSMVPIVSLEKMLSVNPTDIVVFSWNIYKEIKNKIIEAGSNANIWVWNS